MTTRSPWFTPELVAERLEPLAGRIAAALDSGDVTAARAMSEEFAAEWLGLEERLAKLGAGYQAFLRGELPEGTLEAANAWIGGEAGPALQRASECLESELTTRIKEVLDRVEGYEVTGPARGARSAERRHERGQDGAEGFSCEAACATLIDRIDANDTEEAARIARELVVEWPLCQDRLVHLCALYSAFIAERFGEATMNEAHLWISAYAAGEIDRIVDPDLRGTPEFFLQVLSLMRAHTMTGTVTETGDKLVIDLDCSSGLRMWRRDVDRYGVTEGEAEWTFGGDQIPYYCCGCTANLMAFPRRRGREPMWTVQPPSSPSDHCTWIIDKHPSAEKDDQ